VVDPARIIEQLNHAGVEYVVIGGVAATLHGCPEQTYDLDILYRDSIENRRRLLKALSAINAQWEEPLSDSLLQRQPVFALNTAHGDLDIFTTIPGVSDFASAENQTCVFEIDGHKAKTLNLPSLINTKEAAADPNPRKQAALAFLKALHKS
jgi:hypothetical protein